MKARSVLSVCGPLLLSAPAIGESLAVTAHAGTKWISNWERVSPQDNMTGECRQHKSKINQCKLTTVVEAKLSALVALLLDGDAVATWAPGTLSSELTHRENKGAVVTVYASYDFPGAIDRDSLIRSEALQNPDTKQVKITFRTLDQTGPKKDLRLVRFPLVAGSWTLTPLSSTQTRVEHLNLALPGGIVQNTLYYLYNLGTLEASFDTLRALKDAVQRPKYRQAELSFITNF